MKKVIDVSEFNGLIDWSAAAPHIDGAILRAGYRGYGAAGTLVEDKQFRRNLAEVRRLGIPWGVYFLSQAVTEAEAVAEADYVQQLLGGQLAPLGVWLDSEFGEARTATGRADKLNRAIRTVYALAFLHRAQGWRQKTGLYCAADWFRSMISGEAIRLDGQLIWLASVENVKPSAAYDAWQYTWKGTIPGISGDVDISHFSDKIGGSAEMSKYFTDTAGHWAEAAIDRMKESGLMNGKTDTQFCPNDVLTRAEFATVISRLLDKLDGKA